MATEIGKNWLVNGIMQPRSLGIERDEIDEMAYNRILRYLRGKMVLFKNKSH